MHFNYFEFWKPTFLYYRSNLISESLTSCLKNRKFLPYLHHSFPVSSLCRVTLKIATCTTLCRVTLKTTNLHYTCKLVVFPSPCFPFASLVGGVHRVVVYLKREQPSFAGWRLCLPCWLSREHLPIMTPKSESWVPRCVKYEFDIFIMGGILWLYQTQGLFKICAPDTDVT